MVFMFYASIPSFKRYLDTFIPLLTLEIAVSVPYVANSAFLGSLGDPEPIAIYGLSNFFLNVVMSPFMYGVIEVGGVMFAKKFGEKDYRGMINYFYKTVIAMIPVLCFYAFMAIYSDKFFWALGIEEPLASKSAYLVKMTLFYYPLSYFTYLLQTYLMSQNIQKQFMPLNLITIVLCLFFGKLFIVDLNYREVGIIPVKCILEVTNFIYVIAVMIKYGNRETLGVISIEEAKIGLDIFLKKVLCTSIGTFADHGTYEFNTFLVAQLKNVQHLAVYVSWTAITLVQYFICLAMNSTIRTNVGHILGSGSPRKAREEAIAYYFYSFCLAYIYAFCLAYFAYDIARIYINNEEIVPDLVKTLYIVCAFMFTAMMIYPTFGLLPLLNLEAYLMQMTVSVFIVLNAILSSTMCFVFGWGVIGVVLGHTLSVAVMVVLFLYKIFFNHDWTELNEMLDPLLESLEMELMSHHTF